MSLLFSITIPICISSECINIGLAKKVHLSFSTASHKSFLKSSILVSKEIEYMVIINLIFLIELSLLKYLLLSFN